MALKKLSISLEQSIQLRELREAGLSTYKISKTLKLSQPTVWRNIQIMGLCKEKMANEKTQYFRWKDFGNSVI